jgi:leucyl-tRNA synthetase
MLDENYEPLSIEKKWQDKWEQGKKFQPKKSIKLFPL